MIRTIEFISGKRTGKRKMAVSTRKHQLKIKPLSYRSKIV